MDDVERVSLDTFDTADAEPIVLPPPLSAVQRGVIASLPMIERSVIEGNWDEVLGYAFALQETAARENEKIARA